jgi:hypothetical protein
MCGKGMERMSWVNLASILVFAYIISKEIEGMAGAPNLYKFSLSDQQLI